MKQKIVIMMSTYNGEKYIAGQIESILEQDIDADLILFVRDDGSSDATLSILRQFESRISIEYLIDNASLGAAKSFWELLNSAPEADYYAFVDQDDIWDKDKLKVATQAIGETKNIVLWTSNCRLISGDGKIISEKFHIIEPYLDIPSQLICGSIQGCAMVLNKAALFYLRTLKIDKFPMHDLVAMEYILAKGRVIYESEPHFSYRMHGKNLVAKEGKNIIQRTRSTANLWIKNRHMVSNFAAQIENDLEECLDNNILEYLEHLSNCKRSIKSRFYILNNSMTRTTHYAGLRSFKIRVLLGLV